MDMVNKSDITPYSNQVYRKMYSKYGMMLNWSTVMGKVRDEALDRVTKQDGRVTTLEELNAKIARFEESIRAKNGELKQLGEVETDSKEEKIMSEEEMLESEVIGTEEAKSEEVKPDEAEIEEAKPEAAKVEEVKPEETKPEPRLEEVKPEPKVRKRYKLTKDDIVASLRKYYERFGKMPTKTALDDLREAEPEEGWLSYNSYYRFLGKVGEWQQYLEEPEVLKPEKLATTDETFEVEPEPVVKVGSVEASDFAIHLNLSLKAPGMKEPFEISLDLSAV